MGKTLADGYLELRLDPSKLDADTKRAFKAIGFKQRGAEAGKSFGDGLAQGFTDKAGDFAKAATASAARLSVLAASASSAVPAVANLTAALAPASGALVALPAAISAVKVATATFKVAVAGVGDAISAGFTGSAKEAKAALEELPPASRAFAESIIELKPQVEGLKRAVSGRFFKPLQDEVTPLANIYLPLLRREMNDLAGPLGGLGEQFAQTARKADVYQSVSTLFQQTGIAAVRLRPAVDAATTSFAALISATAPLLPGIATSLATATVNAGKFVTEAAKSGKIREVFENAKSTLKDLGGILGNVGSIVKTVFSASGVDDGGLLTNLRELTGQVAAFLKAGEGNTALTSLFSTLSQLGQSMRTALGAVLPAIAQSVNALAPAIGSLAPHFAQLVVAVAPLLPYFSQLAATALTALVPAVASLASWLTKNEGVLKGFGIALAVAYGALKLYAVYTAASTAATKAHEIATNLSGKAQDVWNSKFVTRIRVWAIDAAAATRSAAATAAHTVANTVSSAAQAVWNSVFMTRIRVWAIDAAAAVRSTAATVAHSVATRAAAAATAIWTGVQKAATVATTVMAAVTRGLGVAVRFALGPVGLAITAIGALTAAVVWAYKNNETFRNVVNKAWSAIKTAIKAVGDWFTGTLWPALRDAYTKAGTAASALKTAVTNAWNGVKTAVSGAYNWVRDNVFKPLGDFLTKTVPDKFRSGVATIGKVWLGLQELAKKPVRFVVDTVINQGIIGTFNKVSGFFGGPKIDPVPMPRGFGDGLGHRHGGAPAQRKDRTGDGLGDMLGFLKGPAGWIKDRLSGPLNKIGQHPFAQMLKGMGGKLVNGLIDKAKSLIGSSEYGGKGVGANGLQAGISGALAALRSAFGNVPLISGLRPGSTTLSGNTSYHASGRAIDIAPVRAWAQFLNAAFGPRLKELITPWQDLNLHNGRPHRYTGAVWNQHNFAGGNAHIHAAMDDGGLRFLRPGYNIIPNGTGGLEPIAGPRAVAAMGHRTYNINVTVPVGAHPAEVGRQIILAIQASEKVNGARWRQA